MKTTQPSPLELQVLSVLWEKGECTVRNVLESLPDGRKRAYTTALSVLQTMERKGLVTRKTSTKAHVYKAKKGEKQIIGPMVKELVTNVFAGSAAKLVEATLENARITEAERKELSALLKEQKVRKG